MKVGTDSVLLGAWAPGGSRIFDIGCGTGILSLMMAQRFPTALITAIDIDRGAAEQTRENADGSPWGERITVMNASLQDFAESSYRQVEDMRKSDLGDDVKENLNNPSNDKVVGFRIFDAIICNPPYFVDSLKAKGASRTMARHTDTLSFRDLLRYSAQLLTDDGTASFIIPAQAESDFTLEAMLAGLNIYKRCVVRSKPSAAPKRVMLSFTKQRPAEVEESDITIGDAAYIALTQEFYIN